jgi:hypothetical protein
MAWELVEVADGDDQKLSDADLIDIMLVLKEQDLGRGSPYVPILHKIEPQIARVFEKEQVNEEP